jgi:glycosyltransferase involved in cell wall biosynthesis
MSIPDNSQTEICVVVIGRNEGPRLELCLKSLQSPHCTVYVDSGSVDDSISTAKTLSAHVVELDMSIPFCAARARNEGYRKAIEISPNANFVQFVDGDCELNETWLNHASRFLTSNPGVAVVAGRLHEKRPERSIYNRLGDLEWNSSGHGEVEAVGGIFLVRRTAFDAVGGFDPTVPAGEEPELCQRLKRIGWKIVRLDLDMARHDLAMTRFSQWWRRMVRTGYGSLDVAIRFGIGKFIKSAMRVQFWTFWLFSTLLFGILGFWLGARILGYGSLTIAGILALLLPIHFLRIARRTRRNGATRWVSLAHAFFTVIAFIPQLFGQLLYGLDRLRKRDFRLVEYKRKA